MDAAKAKWLMASVSLAWGSSYLLMKVALGSLEPFNLIALRFGIAFVALSLIFGRIYPKLTLKQLGQGILMGTVLFSNFAFLVYSIKYTNASTAGFLTGTTVVLVPIIESVWHWRLPKPTVVVSIMIVLVGLFLLTVTTRVAVNLGAVYGLLGGLGYAVHILLFDWIAKKGDPFPVSIIQLGVASLLGAIMMFLMETPAWPGSTRQWVAVLILGLVCGGYGFIVQPLAQKHADPATIGIIFSLEPVFSALLSFVFLGEILTVRGYLGALLIFAGVILANLSEKKDSCPLQESRQLNN